MGGSVWLMIAKRVRGLFLLLLTPWHFAFLQTAAWPYFLSCVIRGFSPVEVFGSFLVHELLNYLCWFYLFYLFINLFGHVVCLTDQD